MLLTELGAYQYTEDSGWGIAAGGISGVVFNKQPEGWKIVNKADKLYYPKASNKELIAKFDALPRVTRNEQNELINFKGGATGRKGPSGHGIVHVNSYEINKGKNCYLIGIDEGLKYTPVPDMIEITVSEFKSLQITK